MSYNALDQRSVTLRLEFSIADAVVQRGLLAVLIEAFRAWWSRPRLPPNLPARLRADIGLPPDMQMAYWTDIKMNPRSVPPLHPPL